MSDWDPVTLGGPAGEPEPWYRSRGPLAAVIAVSVALLFLLIAFLIWLFSGGDDDAIAPEDPTTTVAVETTTTTTTTTTVPATAPPPAPTDPPVTDPPVTEPPPVTDPPVTDAPPTIPLPTTTTTTTTTTTSVPDVTSPPSPDSTVWDVIDATPDLSRLRQLLIDAELDDVVDGDEPITLFAPGNDAFDVFEATPGGAAVLGDPNLVTTLMLRHMVFGESLSAADLLALDEVLVATGEFLTVDSGAGTVDGAELVVIDVIGSNGVLHVVERVLAP